MTGGRLKIKKYLKKHFYLPMVMGYLMSIK